MGVRQDVWRTNMLLSGRMLGAEIAPRASQG